jgi:predicted CXXCH cytochrome family protein
MRWLAILVLLGAPRAWASNDAVRGSKHDLSRTGPGPIRALTDVNVCFPCHVPHSSRTNRPDLRAEHVPYASSTMAARPGAPTGATRICLSCHDGTIAVGETQLRRLKMTMDFIPAGSPSNLGTDLRKSHPVSFRPADGGRTHDPADGDPVKLDPSGQLQCTSCHDPHREFGDPVVGKFLVKPSQRSALCLSCHDSVVVEAPDSSHAKAAASFSPAEGNRNGFSSVAEAGCLACHASHQGDVKGRLVPRPDGDDDRLCLRCHSGKVGRHNLAVELAKPSAHAAAERGVHDAAEGRPGSRAPLPELSPGTPRHVACVDCHNPHAASDRAALPGGVSGALAGVWGVDRAGQRVEQVRFEYEVCFKCHGDSANKPPPATAGGPRRAVEEANLRNVFAATAPSSHPVTSPGRSALVPGLMEPWTTASTISCGDCHASDAGPGAGGAGPAGPHGSVYPRLLERSYSTADHTPESASAYALCYKCHDRDTLVAPARRDLARYPDPSGFPEHARHLGPAVNAPCSACHAAHGVSSQAGSPAENAHLVDFDVTIVGALRGERRYRSQGPGSGSCTLSCHGNDHDARSYPLTVTATP